MFRKTVAAVLTMCVMFVACFFMHDKNVVSTALAQPQEKTKEVEENVNSFKFTEKEKEMMEEYKKGNAYSDEYVPAEKKQSNKIRITGLLRFYNVFLE